ncbi:MAG: SGNH/GDSL hydrolase family protein [Roseburia sp.]|nr:SGNH/GDSL hydrolase family protein [Roseburia sp.]MCM1099400.1 SGNH/GDSL hydrolase family protein [Ruminococcus flavefaciens]
MNLNYEAAIANRGNQARIKDVFRRALRGEKLTIGFLGGSITQGSLATDPKLCYAYRVFDWWRKTFPEAELTYRNAGIGATDSQFGCARVDSDLLAYRPDFVIVEFSVNDASTPHYLETYEGLVRKIYGAEGQPAVLMVHNVYYDSGANAQLMHGKAARYYELPAVSMQSCIYPELVAGRLENREITPDDLHPNDRGHELVASVITYFLGKILGDLENLETPVSLKEKPLTANAYETSVRYRNDNSSPVLDGFTLDPAPQEEITDIFRKGWTASEKGASIVFEAEGSCIAVQYRRTIQLPAPVAELILDGDEAHPFVLDANFDETWGDKLALDTILEHGESRRHRIEIRLRETHPEDRLPFYLVSVIVS